MKTSRKIDRKLLIHQTQAQGLNVAKKFRSTNVFYYTPYIDNVVFFNFSMDVDYVIGSSKILFCWQVLFNVISEFGNRNLVLEKLKEKPLAIACLRNLLSMFVMSINSNSYMYEYCFIICSCNREYSEPFTTLQTPHTVTSIN